MNAFFKSEFEIEVGPRFITDELKEIFWCGFGNGGFSLRDFDGAVPVFTGDFADVSGGFFEIGLGVGDGFGGGWQLKVEGESEETVFSSGADLGCGGEVCFFGLDCDGSDGFDSVVECFAGGESDPVDFVGFGIGGECGGCLKKGLIAGEEAAHEDDHGFAVDGRALGFE